MATRLVLGLGNDLLCDDAVGLRVARLVQEQEPPDTDVIETGEAGLALLEFLYGYQQAVLVDSIQTGAKPGTIHRLGKESFRKVVAPSAHYAGLPEVFALGDQLGIPLPERVDVVAIETSDPYSFSSELTPEVESAVGSAVEAVLEILDCSISISTK